MNSYKTITAMLYAELNRHELNTLALIEAIRLPGMNAAALFVGDSPEVWMLVPVGPGCGIDSPAELNPRLMIASQRGPMYARAWATVNQTK
jgi:hypothetical protein